MEEEIILYNLKLDNKIDGKAVNSVLATKYEDSVFPSYYYLVEDTYFIQIKNADIPTNLKTLLDERVGNIDSEETEKTVTIDDLSLEFYDMAPVPVFKREFKAVVNDLYFVSDINLYGEPTSENYSFEGGQGAMAVGTRKHTIYSVISNAQVYGVIPVKDEYNWIKDYKEGTSSQILIREGGKYTFDANVFGRDVYVTVDAPVTNSLRLQSAPKRAIANAPVDVIGGNGNTSFVNGNDREQFTDSPWSTAFGDDDVPTGGTGGGKKGGIVVKGGDFTFSDTVDDLTTITTFASDFEAAKGDIDISTGKITYADTEGLQSNEVKSKGNTEDFDSISLSFTNIYNKDSNNLTFYNFYPYFLKATNNDRYLVKKGSENTIVKIGDDNDKNGVNYAQMIDDINYYYDHQQESISIDLDVNFPTEIIPVVEYDDKGVVTSVTFSADTNYNPDYEYDLYIANQISLKNDKGAENVTNIVRPYLNNGESPFTKQEIGSFAPYDPFYGSRIWSVYQGNYFYKKGETDTDFVAKMIDKETYDKTKVPTTIGSITGLTEAKLLGNTWQKFVEEIRPYSGSTNLDIVTATTGTTFFPKTLDDNDKRKFSVATNKKYFSELFNTGDYYTGMTETSPVFKCLTINDLDYFFLRPKEAIQTYNDLSNSSSFYLTSNCYEIWQNMLAKIKNNKLPKALTQLYLGNKLKLNLGIETYNLNPSKNLFCYNHTYFYPKFGLGKIGEAEKKGTKTLKGVKQEILEKKKTNENGSTSTNFSFYDKTKTTEYVLNPKTYSSSTGTHYSVVASDCYTSNTLSYEKYNCYLRSECLLFFDNVKATLKGTSGVESDMVSCRFYNTLEGDIGAVHLIPYTISENGNDFNVTFLDGEFTATKTDKNAIDFGTAYTIDNTKQRIYIKENTSGAVKKYNVYGLDSTAVDPTGMISNDMTFVEQVSENTVKIRVTFSTPYMHKQYTFVSNYGDSKSKFIASYIDKNDKYFIKSADAAKSPKDITVYYDNIVADKTPIIANGSNNELWLTRNYKSTSTTVTTTSYTIRYEKDINKGFKYDETTANTYDTDCYIANDDRYFSNSPKKQKLGKFAKNGVTNYLLFEDTFEEAWSEGPNNYKITCSEIQGNFGVFGDAVFCVRLSELDEYSQNSTDIESSKQDFYVLSNTKSGQTPTTFFIKTSEINFENITGSAYNVYSTADGSIMKYIGTVKPYVTYLDFYDIKFIPNTKYYALTDGEYNKVWNDLTSKTVNGFGGTLLDAIARENNLLNMCSVIICTNTKDLTNDDGSIIVKKPMKLYTYHFKGSSKLTNNRAQSAMDSFSEMIVAYGSTFVNKYENEYDYYASGWL